MNDHLNASNQTSGTPTGYTLDDIKRIERSISSAPLPERPLTTADALAALATTLRKARARGHSPASLVRICQQQGLHVSERAVSRAIATARGGQPAKKRTTAGTQSPT
jgi:hypothetical protein